MADVDEVAFAVRATGQANNPIAQKMTSELTFIGLPPLSLEVVPASWNTVSSCWNEWSAGPESLGEEMLYK
jgi:hypothetical protein